MSKFFEIAKKYLIEDDAGGAPPPDAGGGAPPPDAGGGGAPPPPPDMGGGGAPPPDAGGGGAPQQGGEQSDISNLKYTYYVALLVELYNTKLEGDDVRQKILLMEKYIGKSSELNTVSKAKWVIDFISKHFISTNVREGTKEKVKATKDKFAKARDEIKKNPAKNIHVITDSFLMDLAKTMYTVVCTNASASKMSLPEIEYGERNALGVTFTNASSVFDEILKNVDHAKVDIGNIE